MWLSILLLIFILAIAFFQAVQGFFSALIMVVLTMCCAALSLGTHEWIAIHYLSKWKPDYAYALSLALTFGLPLLILRVLFDQSIKRAPLLPSIVDRIGGGLCGIITGLTMGGMTALALQLIPFDYTFLGYTRFHVVADKKPGEDNTRPTPADLAQGESEIFLSPDRFAVGLGSMLSDGLFSGDRSFGGSEADLVQRYGWANFTHSENTRYSPPGSFQIVKVDEKVPYVYKLTANATFGAEEEKYDSIPAPAGEKYVAVRFALDNKARNRTKRFVFTLRQLRLVGRDDSRKLKQFYPIAIQSPSATHKDKHVSERLFNPDFYHVVDDLFEPLELKDSEGIIQSDNEFEVVYRLPKEGFEPMFIEYKLGARAAFPAVDEVPAAPTGGGSANAEPPAPRAPENTNPGGTVADSGRGGRVRKFTTNQGKSKFGADLPIALKKYTELNNAELSRGRLANGHLVAVVAEQDAGTMTEVSKFEVPEDKRLLHLNVSNLTAQSTYGKAVTKAIAAANNFIVESESGAQFRIVGKYAVADVDGQQFCEVQYFPEQIGSIGGLGEFSKIRDRHLVGSYELVLLFLVDPGAKIKSFSTGGSNARKDDLSGENLVAPQ